MERDGEEKQQKEICFATTIEMITATEISFWLLRDCRFIERED